MAGCDSENSAGEFGDVSAESAKALAPSDPASLFRPTNLSKAFDAAASILPGNTVLNIKVEPGKMFVSAKPVKNEFATIVVAPNGKVHAVVSQGPTICAEKAWTR